MMAKFTKQMQEWAGNFGKEYTNRDASLLEEIEAIYKQRYGITRTEMNTRFIGDLDKDMKVLEVGFRRHTTYVSNSPG